jgi:hypothetical protein
VQHDAQHHHAAAQGVEAVVPAFVEGHSRSGFGEWRILAPEVN